jgi:hypothetical protein
MKTVSDFPGETFATTVFTRKPKIACLHPEAGSDRGRAHGRFKIKVRYYESPGTSPKIRILHPAAPTADRENQAV